MNELIRINYESEQPTVSDFKKRLDTCKSFEEFFIKVSKIKVASDREELRELQKIIQGFMAKYGHEAIIYLNDCISAEIVLPCKSKESILHKESQIKKEILNNFNGIFPEYDFVETEKSVDSIGRIDIYAKHKERPVIIELKTGHTNPNSQLIAYGSKFKDPILIGITEEPLPENKKMNNITYLVFNELKGGVKTWII